jgi:hypothetical protein
VERGGGTAGNVNEGCSSPATGLPYAVGLPPLAVLNERPSRTACDRVPANDGFWNVAIRPVKPASATPLPTPSARWIGGRADQATGTATRPSGGGGDGGGDGDGAPAPASPLTSSRPASRRPLSLSSLNLSRRATSQPSASARVTRDAIRSA